MSPPCSPTLSSPFSLSLIFSGDLPSFLPPGWTAGNHPSCLRLLAMPWTAAARSPSCLLLLLVPGMLLLLLPLPLPVPVPLLLPLLLLMLLLLLLLRLHAGTELAGAPVVMLALQSPLLLPLPLLTLRLMVRPGLCSAEEASGEAVKAPAAEGRAQASASAVRMLAPWSEVVPLPSVRSPSPPLPACCLPGAAAGEGMDASTPNEPLLLATAPCMPPPCRAASTPASAPTPSPCTG